jgi:hypothetical protein
MIQYRNIRRIDNLEFGQYTQLKGYSHSFLKAEIFGSTPEFKDTDKVIIGRLVDAILTDPGKADMLHALYPIARSIAQKVRAAFGEWIKRFETQISYTADMMYEGHVLPITGRIDFLLPGHAVIDLKVSHAKDVHGLIKFMGYENQLWNYANLAEVKRKYIMIHSVPLKQTFMIDLGVVSQHNEFWEAKILKFGLPMAA